MRFAITELILSPSCGDAVGVWLEVLLADLLLVIGQTHGVDVRRQREGPVGEDDGHVVDQAVVVEGGVQHVRGHEAVLVRQRLQRLLDVPVPAAHQQALLGIAGSEIDRDQDSRLNTLEISGQLGIHDKLQNCMTFPNKKTTYYTSLSETD